MIRPSRGKPRTSDRKNAELRFDVRSDDLAIDATIEQPLDTSWTAATINAVGLPFAVTATQHS